MVGAAMAFSLAKMLVAKERLAVAGASLIEAFRGAARTVEASRSYWPPDVLRHTFASRHHAQHQDEASLKARMGHGELSDMLHQHYRTLATSAEAARFWGLRP